MQQETSAGGRGVAAGWCGRCHVAAGPERTFCMHLDVIMMADGWVLTIISDTQLPIVHF